MAEIKNTFLQGRMNKDLDERILPNGEYRDAMNIQISTSDGSDVGTVQNILGNLSKENIVPANCKCIGAVADEKTNRLYWFIKRDFSYQGASFEAIIEYSEDFGIVPVIVDTKINTPDAVLKFPDKIITGINIIDDLLFWTDGINEPRKININTCKKGTSSIFTHTQLISDFGSFDGFTIEEVGLYQDDSGATLSPSGMRTTFVDGITAGRYFYFHKDQLDKLFNYSVSHDSEGNILRHYREGVFLGNVSLKIWNDGTNTNGIHARLDDNATSQMSFTDVNRTFRVGDILFGENIPVDIKEKNILVIKPAPKNKLNVKINTTDNPNKESLFESVFPRFSYRYKYNDNEYSPFAPFTDVIFNPDHKNKSLDFVYNAQEPYNTSMTNFIDSIELSDFIEPDLDEEVKSIDIIYKSENSPAIYSIATINRNDEEWYSVGLSQNQDVGSVRRLSNVPKYRPSIYGGLIKGRYIVESENISHILPENQILRPWDAVPKKALAQEVTGNRIVYANYVQGYTSNTKIPNLLADYKPRKQYNLPLTNFDDCALPSIKSQRNYQLGVVFGDKHGRETPVFTSNKSAITVPWKNSEGVLSSTQSYQIEAKLQQDPPSFADYIKYYIKETSGEYYNLVMEKAYLPADISTYKKETRHHIWLSFPSSERNKVTVDDYLILKKKIGTGESKVTEKNRFKILDIQDNAPDHVKFEYALLGDADQTTTGTDFLNSELFTSSSNRPTVNKKQLRLIGSKWLNDGKNAPISSGGKGYADENSDRDYLQGQMYISWFRTESNGNILTSNKYRIIDSTRQTSGNIHITLDKKILLEDHVISTGSTSISATTLDDDLTIQIERRKEKDTELFSGKFFVKVITDPIIYDNILDDNSLLKQYVWIARQDVSYAADKINTGNNQNSGIVNTTYTYSVPSGGDNSPEEVHSQEITANETNWGNLEQYIGKKFFIDAMFMKAGQISDNNYAKNSGKTWVGIHSSYPPNPEWVANTLEEGPQDEKGVDGIVVHRGWKFFAKNRVDSVLEDGSYDYISKGVNGLEGIVTTTSYHVGDESTPISGDKPGIRRWKTEDSTGSGMYKSHFNVDNTYGQKVGKFYMHLSFLAPGEDLVDSVTGMGDDLFGQNAVAKGLQGIWGGGVITDPEGYGFGNTATTVGANVPAIAMEGKFFDDNYRDAPGPGVPNSFGYDENYRSRHENQWNPAWPDDEGGKIQEFIDNLEPGNKFKFEGDTDATVYTILRKSVKKIYNHTSWHYTRTYDGSTNHLDSVGLNSVSNMGQRWAKTIDGSNPNGDSAKLSDFKNRIQDFGRANNRRVVYILELDKDPRVSTFNPVDGSNIDLDTSTRIQFVEKASSFIELDAQKPIIWETEPKESIDIEIYHEASNPIPTKITDETKEFFAPVGCIVQIMDDNSEGDYLTDIKIRKQNKDLKKNILKRWLSPTEFEVTEGFAYSYFDNSTNAYKEVDYSGYKFKFIRNDGSYTVGRLAAQASDPDNSQGIGGTSPSALKNRFVLSPIIGKDLEAGLSWYNCFSFGNGLESNRIKDGFNLTKLTNGPIVSSTIDTTYTEEKRTSGLIYSGIYNPDTSINELNQFIQAEKITKDLNPTYGSIQKLFQRRVGLVAFCEDRVVNIVAGKDTLFNADGNPQLIATDRVLGDATPFVGDYGISKNPESFAKESYRAYFTDKQRGAVLRLSMDGLTPISDAGMRDWFRDNLVLPNELIGTYDEYKKEYNLTLKKDFSENLILNSDVSEGQQIINITTPPENLIQNGGFFPTIYNQPQVTNDLLNNHLLNYSQKHLYGTTKVTLHPSIPEGYFQEYNAGVPAVAASDTVFTTNVVSGYWNPSTDGTTLPSGANTGIFGAQSEEIIVNEEFLCSQNINNTRIPFEGYNNNTNLNNNLNDQYLYYSPLCYYASTGSSAGYYNSGNYALADRQASGQSGTQAIAGVLNFSPDNYNTYVGVFALNVNNLGLTWGFNNTAPFGLVCKTYGTQGGSNINPNNPHIVFPYSHDTGTMPNDDVEGDVLDWVNDPVNTNNVDYSNVTNTTCFAGEEIAFEIDIAIPHLNKSPGYSNDVYEFYVTLMDGNAEVDDDNVFDPVVQGFFGNSNIDYSVSASNIANGYYVDRIYGFTPPTDPMRHLSSPDGHIGNNRAVIDSASVTPGTTIVVKDKRYSSVARHSFMKQSGNVGMGCRVSAGNAPGPGSSATKTTASHYKLKGRYKLQATTSSGGYTYDEEQIVINNVGIKIQQANVDDLVHSTGDKPAGLYVINKVKLSKIQKIQTPESLGVVGVPSTDAIPSSEVPAWGEVSHYMTYNGHWVLSPATGATMQPAYNAFNNTGFSEFGPENPSPGTSSAIAADGVTTYTWPDPGAATTADLSVFNTIGSYMAAFHNDEFLNAVYTPYLSSSINSTINSAEITLNHQESSIYVDSPGTSSFISTAVELSELKTTDKWLLVDVTLINPTFTSSASDNFKGISVRNLIDANAYNGIAYFDSTQFHSSSMPYGSFGTLNTLPSNATVGTDRGFFLLDTDEWPQYDFLHGSHVLDPANSSTPGYWSTPPDGAVNLRAIVKVNANSLNVVNNVGHLKIGFYDFIGEVRLINVKDITQTPVGGNINEWTFPNSNSTWSVPAQPNSFLPQNYGGHDNQLIVNSISRRRLFANANLVTFFKATAPSQILFQDFNLVTNPWNFQKTTDGYTFTFKVANHSGDTLRITLRGSIETDTNSIYYVDDNGTPGYYFIDIEVNHSGEYKADFNLDGITSNIILKKKLVSGEYFLYNSGNISTGTGSSNSLQNSIRIHNKNYYNPTSPNTNPVLLTCTIDDLSLIDESSVVTGGAADAWTFDFDPLVFPVPIAFDQGVISVNNAETSYSIQQVINEDIKLGDKFRVKFNYTIDSGSFRVYYFINDINKNGFRTDTIQFDASMSGSVLTFDSEIPPSGSYIFNTIGDQTAEPGDLISTFVVEILESGTTFTIDNISMKQVYPLFEPQTVTYSERNKGWISFKSFTPENGVSLAKQYYTFNNGRLYQHHANTTRNQFYDQDVSTITESSVTGIFNTEPSLVKMFNTLSYEGTQSRVTKFDDNYKKDTIKPYNITEKPGWYVDYITTDKQTGNIKEFVEKEGKWFNYIKGNINAEILTSEFSFQGLGTVLSVNASNLGFVSDGIVDTDIVTESNNIVPNGSVDANVSENSSTETSNGSSTTGTSTSTGSSNAGSSGGGGGGGTY